MAKIVKTPTGEFHSGYGCIIMTAAVGVFSFLAWWMFYYVPITLDKEIAAISQDTPATLPQIAPVTGLQEKLAAFAKAASAGTPATLTLSIPELNALLLLTPDAATGGYKDMLRVRGLDAEKSLILTDASLPMNTARFWEEKKRYLVGQIDFLTEKTALGPDIKVVAVRVPDKKVPEEMIKGMQMYGYFGPYHNDATLGPIFKAIREFKVQPDSIVITTGP